MPTFSEKIQQYSPLLKNQPQTTVKVELRGPISISQATNVYYLPGTNHALIQEEYFNDYFRQ